MYSKKAEKLELRVAEYRRVLDNFKAESTRAYERDIRRWARSEAKLMKTRKDHRILPEIRI